MRNHPASELKKNYKAHRVQYPKNFMSGVGCKTQEVMCYCSTYQKLTYKLWKNFKILLGYILYKNKEAALNIALNNNGLCFGLIETIIIQTLGLSLVIMSLLYT